MNVCMYVCMCVYVCVYMYVCMYVCICMYVCVYMYVCCICMYVCVHVCMCVYACMFVRMYVGVPRMYGACVLSDCISYVCTNPDVVRVLTELIIHIYI